MRRYETIFILRPDLGEAAQKETIKRFEGIIASSSGDLVETDEWGFRELAYNIKGERRGYYVRLDYGGAGATLNEVERNLKLADGVLRHLSVLVEDDADLEKARAEVEARKRRTAEARAAAEARIAAAATADDAIEAAPAAHDAGGAGESDAEAAAGEAEGEKGSSGSEGGGSEGGSEN